MDGVNRTPCKMILEYKDSLVTGFDSPRMWYGEQKCSCELSMYLSKNQVIFIGVLLTSLLTSGGVQRLYSSSILIPCIIILLLDKKSKTI